MLLLVKPALIWGDKNSPTKIKIAKPPRIKDHFFEIARASTFNSLKLMIKTADVNSTNLLKLLDSLKQNIATSTSQSIKTLDISIFLDDIQADFDSLKANFSIYKFVNNISKLIAEGSTVSLC